MRSLTPAFIAELSSATLRPAIFCQIQFLTGSIYVWSGLGDLQWNGQTFTGIGTLGNISEIEESSDTSANGITLTLSGIPQDLIGKALNETRQGQAVKLWFAALDARNVVMDPFQCFAGRVDVPSIDEGSDTSTISITVENRLIDLNRSRERRYTDQDQQGEYPNDLGFQYVAALQDWAGIWGKSTGTGIHRTPGGIGSGGGLGGGRRGNGGGGGFGGRGGPVG